MIKIEYSAKEKAKWFNPLLDSLQEQLEQNIFWKNYIENNVKPLRVGLHLGIFVEPYLELIIEGKKTLESRFSINRTSPYRQALKGDILLLKKSCGPIIAICQISESWSYVLDKDLWEDIKETHQKALCIQGPDFWIKKQDSNYATLMKITNVCVLNSPINFVKRDRRGWVTLHSQMDNDHLTLFS